MRGALPKASLLRGALAQSLKGGLAKKDALRV
eukprot:CAMPEP_0174708454 /NCGR_PEP_ID=MMETSP1094-20130205/10706_1 /TAXON_ID=156173 /ORGANISM="Chrysochromulina brevifilum, Strain UTEX LB 985" /LENGTH=31 /DNA_ID= /DNA_START= /DNA_END= /DNA_ORIENTATION=